METKPDEVKEEFFKIFFYCQTGEGEGEKEFFKVFITVQQGKEEVCLFNVHTY